MKIHGETAVGPKTFIGTEHAELFFTFSLDKQTRLKEITQRLSAFQTFKNIIHFLSIISIEKLE